MIKHKSAFVKRKSEPKNSLFARLKMFKENWKRNASQFFHQIFMTKTIEISVSLHSLETTLRIEKFSI